MNFRRTLAVIVAALSMITLQAATTSGPPLTRQNIATRLHPKTAAETALSVTPVDLGFPVGDPRRASIYENVGLIDFGDAPIYVDSDTVKVNGDVRSRYPDRTRIAVVNVSTKTFAQVLSTSFSAGQTTIETRNEIGNLPTSPVAIWKYTLPQLDHTNTFMVDFNAPQTMQIINKNIGGNAATHVLIGDFDSSGVVIVATKSTTATSPYLSLGPGNPASYIHTGLTIPVVIGTHDRSRLIIDGDGLASQFTTDLIVQKTNENPNGSTTSTLAVDGTATAYLSLRVASAEKAVVTANTTSMVIGTVVSEPVGFYTNGSLRMQIPAAGILNFANDAAAAAGGVPVGGIYRNGSVLMIRVSDLAGDAANEDWFLPDSEPQRLAA